MYYYVSTGRFGLGKYAMHAVCWMTALFTTLLPLTGGEHYGTDDQQTGWCFLTDGKTKSDESTIWTLVTFDMVLCLSLIVIVYYVVRISTKYRNITNAKVSAIVDSLYLYPASMVFTWLPNLVYFTFIQNFTSRASNVYANTVILILSTQNGTLTACIFFWMSCEARSRWIYFFKRLLTCFEKQAPAKSADTIQVFYLQDNDVDDTVYQRQLRPQEGEWQGSDFMQSDISSERTDSISLHKLSTDATGLRVAQGPNGASAYLAPRVGNLSPIRPGGNGDGRGGGGGSGANSPAKSSLYGSSPRSGMQDFSHCVGPMGQPIPHLSETPSSYARSSLFNRSPAQGQSFMSSRTEVGSYFNKSNSGHLAGSAGGNNGSGHSNHSIMSAHSAGGGNNSSSSTAHVGDVEKGTINGINNDKGNNMVGSQRSISHLPPIEHSDSLVSSGVGSQASEIFNPMDLNNAARLTTTEYEDMTQMSSTF